jgi:hypothetical protein
MSLRTWNIVGSSPFFTGKITRIPESVMSDHRSNDRIRRLNPNGAAARADTMAASMWTTLWTWLAAVAAIAVILGVVFGYTRTDPAGQSAGPATATTGPATTGSAPVPSTPLSGPRRDDGRTPAPALPTDDDP